MEKIGGVVGGRDNVKQIVPIKAISIWRKNPGAGFIVVGSLKDIISIDLTRFNTRVPDNIE
jgi:hypothetical protein